MTRTKVNPKSEAAKKAWITIRQNQRAGVYGSTKRPKVVALGKPIFTHKFPSESTPKVKHTVTVYSKGKGKGYVVKCTCRGFNTHNHCWHTDQIKEAL